MEITNNIKLIEKETSEVNPNYEISTEVWVLSIITTGEKSLIYGGHSALVIEGYKKHPGTFNPKRFCNQYDIQVKTFKNQSSFFNEYGYISEIRCFESLRATKSYQKCFKKTYYIPKVLHAKVLDMIDKIKAESKEVEEMMEEIKKLDMNSSMYEEKIKNLLETKYLAYKYQLIGKTHFFADDNNGENCCTWVLSKLKEIGFNLELKKPKPIFASLNCLTM